MGESHYWRGIEEREGTPEYRKTLKSEFPAPPKEAERGGEPADGGEPLLQRRSFLKAAGFSLGSGLLLPSCQRGVEEKLVPLLVSSERGTPGKSYWYASTCGGCSAGCGILAKNRDGRPIKIEGNPDHPLTRGGLCAVGQATVLGVYDSLRLAQPRLAGQTVGWEHVDAEVTRRLGELEDGVFFLSGTITSPTTKALIAGFLDRYDNSGHVTYDPVSCSAILEAHEKTFGKRVLPHYRFDRAQIIVSFDADFLGTWISPVEFTKAYVRGRSLDGGAEAFSRHVQFEGRLSLTGSNADQRIQVDPRQCAAALVRIAGFLAEKAGAALPISGPGVEPGAAGEPTEEQLGEGLDEKPLREIAAALWAARGRSLVVCGSNDVRVQCAVNFVNHALGNYGQTLDIEQPSLQKAGDDRALDELIAKMGRGEVKALFIAGVNPAYSLPRGEEFVAALERVGLTVCFAEHLDETAELCGVVSPVPHFLESWDDAELIPGLVGVAQPLLEPLGDTRTLREALARWMGAPRSDYEILRSHWEEELFPLQKAATSFQAFWERALQDGFARIERSAPGLGPWSGEFEWPDRASSPPATSLSLVLYQKAGMLDGRHAHNPWLHELPDPVTKAVWDNYVCVAPALARKLGIEQGDVLRVRAGAVALKLPALLQPGQHEGVVAIAVGYGRKGTDRFARIGPQWLYGEKTVEEGGTVGRNAYVLARRSPAGIQLGNEVTLELTGKKAKLALTQTHHSLSVPEELGGEKRDHVRETTLAAFLEDPASGNRAEPKPDQLWKDDHPVQGHQWGLAIDLNRCTGCSACLIGCQAENNVPVVGKDEVFRRREMHWIRIDRYYAGDDRDVEVVHQPVMCQHCGNAPCETVCPVLATVHSSEGLNQQVYNRCIGTRYCANNCPYKVRRFNWFEYRTEEERENLALNPDVTTRSRGVMEKCSLCIQRIQEAKAEAARRGAPLADGDIQTACQQSCPGEAIVFGDVNDPESRVSRLKAGPRHYHLLDGMNLRPAVGYLTKVRNRDPESS